MNRKLSLITMLAVLALLVSAGVSTAQAPIPGSPNGPAAPLGTAITYQGRLTDGGGPANGSYDFQFILYDDPSVGLQVGATVVKEDVPVSAGLFTVQLDFGPNAFGPSARWLKVGVRPGASTGPFTDLTPRQPLTPAPTALFASNAGSVPWGGLTGVPDLQMRVNGACSPGSSIRVINPDGGVVCQPDNNTTYTNGTGLALVGTQFSLVGSYSLPQSCTNGQFPEWSGGAWACGNKGWGLTGNAGTSPTTNFLGTSDPVMLTIKVGGHAVLRLLPDIYSPNIIAGSESNQVAAGVHAAVIGGGGTSTASNNVSANYCVVSGGVGNTANGEGATISGGETNTAGVNATVGGGWNNNATGAQSTVGGGAYNSATDSVATVGGGNNNVASGYKSTISGGYKNSADGDDSTIAGGDENSTSANFSNVAGGYKNNVTGDYATVGGGWGNVASGTSSVVSGGGGWGFTALPNKATGDWSTVGGGRLNTASGPAATVGGGDGNTASAVTDTVPGGSGNTASGGYSFAAGAQASATQIGSFVWSSSEATASWGDFTFTARAPGGVRFYSGSGTSTGVQLSSGGNSFGSISDRNVKDNFNVVDNRWLLDQLAAMPIETWNLKSQAADIRHIGPVAQDFNGLLSPLFGTVEDPLRINNMDAVGVSLAAIQGLYQLNQAQAARIKTLEDKLSRQEAGGAASASNSLPLGWMALVGFLAVLVVAQAGMFFYFIRKMRGRL